MSEPEEVQSEVIENNEVESPDESVVDETGEATPQAPDDTEEFEIDLGSDEQEVAEVTSATVPVHKLSKLRKRAQKAEKQVDSVSAENEALRVEMAALRNDVAKVTAGPLPDILDYLTTEDYMVALNEHNSKSVVPVQVAQVAPAQPVSQPAPPVDDSFFDAHYEAAEKLPLKNGEFEEAERSFRDQLTEAFGDIGQGVADSVLREAGDKSPLVAVALGKNKNETQKLIAALLNDSKAGTRTAEKLIWKLSEKTTLKRKNNRVSTSPDDVPKGKGNADSLNDQISKAAKDWRDDPTLAKSRKLRDLRNKANG